MGLLCLCFATPLHAAFDEESYLFEAVELESQNKFDKARDMYLVLYEETNKLEYYKEAITLSMQLGNYAATLEFIHDYLKKGGTKDIIIQKVMLGCYLALNDLTHALEVGLAIEKQETNPAIQNVIGSIYAQKQDYKNALFYLHKDYKRTKSEDSLRKITAILLTQKQSGDALSLLDSHIREYGCTEEFCAFSIEVYKEFSQLDKIAHIFQQKFNKSPTIENAQNLILIYTQQRKFKQASQIATQFPFNPYILIHLYSAQKDYYNLSLQYQILYSQSHDPYHSALSSLYAFEALSDKSMRNKAQIQAITHNLSEALKSMQSQGGGDLTLQYKPDQVAFLLNFLGYVLIDYEIDVARGVELVQKALEYEPKTLEYLDSLAWGYYKLKNCTKAKEIFEQIPDSEVQKEQELKQHKQSIFECKI